MNLFRRIRWVLKRPGCNWRCSKYRFACVHLSEAEALAISKAMRDGTIPVRKLPPRGCQPQDCCGDPEAHLD